MFDLFRENLLKYTNGFSAGGVTRLVIDILLFAAIIYFLIRLISKKIKQARFYIILAGILLLYLISILFSFTIVKGVLGLIVFWIVGCLIIVYSQEIRHEFEILFTNNKINNSYTSKQEKQEIISVLCSTVDYLSKRHIGALITIEKEDSLNTFIEKAIPLNSMVNQEILTTIFTPGTACHDGAVIIRKNRIMCAGAYFPSTDKYDVPKFLGTRHRAAIGISERYDALTIVVSEETGNVSVTSSGVINLELTIERLEEMLDAHLYTK
jgi:diadenylate cyclase